MRKQCPHQGHRLSAVAIGLSGTLLLLVGSCAARNGSNSSGPCGSETACLRLCDGGDGDACLDLGLLYVGENHLDEAADAFQRGCGVGHLGACAREVETLQTQGREGEAEAVVRQICGAEGAQGERCRALGELIDGGRGGVETRPLFAGRCEAGDMLACRSLGLSLRAAGELTAAERPLRRACEAGDLEGCLALAALLEEVGRSPEAEAVRGEARALGADE